VGRAEAKPTVFGDLVGFISFYLPPTNILNLMAEGLSLEEIEAFENKLSELKKRIK